MGGKIMALFNGGNGGTNTNRKIIGVGDSIMVGSSANGQNFIYFAKPHMASPLDTVNLGAGGSTMLQAYNNRVASASHRNVNSDRNVFFINAGTNDIAQASLVTGGAGFGGVLGGTPITGQQLAETIYNERLIPLFNYYLSLGNDVRVVVNTIVPRLWAGTANDKAIREAARLAYNDLLRNNNVGIYVADVASLTEFGPVDALGTPNATHYVADKIHLKASAYALCADGQMTKVGFAWLQALSNYDPPT